MFGQHSSTPFGSPPAPAGFGSPAPAFGSPAPAFGAPAPGGFGAPTGFGTSTGFGAAPSTGGFGNTGGFGASTSTTSVFGGGGGAFGGSSSSSPFGAPAPAPSGGLFGSAPAPSGGLFGGAPAPSAFGAPSTFGGASTFGSAPTFGAQQPAFGPPAPAPATGGLFGAAPAPAFGSTGAFGAPAPAFGSPAPAPGGLFGAPPPAPGGLFGGGAPQIGGGQGTKLQPFQVTQKIDGGTTINMQSISAMPVYENKSFEELRFEDYSQGNRGTQGTAAPGGFGGFGAPAPAVGGMFGSTGPAPAPFGAPAFGAPSATPAFGAAPAPATGGLFGSIAPAPAFGAPAPTTGFGSSSFGKPASGGLFSPAPAPQLFGSPSGAPGFGAAPAPVGGGLFGSNPAPAPFGSQQPSAFGGPAPAPSTGGLFGSAPAPPPAFGSAPTGGLFGQPAPAPLGGLFGSSPAPAFGASPTGSNLFGQPAPAPLGLFGSPPAPAFGSAPAGGMFGQSAPAAAGSFFGGPAPTPGYGAPTPAMAALVAMVPPVGSIIPPAANEVLAHQIQALENKRKEIQKLDVWRGKSPDQSSVVPVSQPEFSSPEFNSFQANTSSYSGYRQSPRSSAKIRPRGFGSVLSPTPTATSPTLRTIGNGGRAMMSPDTYAASSVKHLVIKPDSLTPKPRLRLQMASNPVNPEPGTNNAIPVPRQTIASPPSTENGLGTSSKQTPTARTSIQVFTREDITETPAASTGGRTPASEMNISPPADPGYDFYQQVIASPDGVVAPPLPTPARAEQKGPAAYVPTLSKPGYVVSPSIDELASKPEADLATLTCFSVKREPFGMVEWEGAVDVRFANLDRIVEINQNDVSVYMQDELEGRKPAVGSKLNRPAIITFFNVYPRNGGAAADDESKEKFAKKIEKSTKKMDADLISYDRRRGLWKIRVHHFSRYGLDEESDDEELPDDSFTTTEEVQDDAALISDAEADMNDSSAKHEAEAAYQTLLAEVSASEPVAPENTVAFEEEYSDDGYFLEGDEEECVVHENVTRRRIISDSEIVGAGLGLGICSLVAGEVGQTNKATCDFGRRMGRSFRTSFHRDGTFLKLTPVSFSSGPSLVRCHPVFTASPEAIRASAKYLEVHKANASRNPTALDDGTYRMTLDTNAMNDVLHGYAAHGPKIDSLAFSLLACLLASSPNDEAYRELPEDGSRFNVRQTEEVRRWLLKACATDVAKEIESALAHKDFRSAVFAALTGADLENACSIAVASGQTEFVRLATVLPLSIVGAKDVMQCSSSSTDLIQRIYCLIGGDVEEEERLHSAGASRLDWRRRFAMRISYDIAAMQEHRTLSQFVGSYSEDAKRGTTPFPYPWYKSSGSDECLLFRLLRLAENPQTISCAEIIDPLAHTPDRQDMSLAFHLASVMQEFCPPLSVVDEEILLDSYASQLISRGKWEWAVYVSLCSLNTTEIDETIWKRRKAKELILRHFEMDEPAASSRKRQFLEQEVGIPREWFEEALAIRCANGGDPFRYIQHLASFSPESASAVVDEVILPNLLFMNREDTDKTLALLASFGDAISDLGSALYNLFQLSKDLRSKTIAEIKTDLPDLHVICDEIEKALMVAQNNSQGRASLALFPSFFRIPKDNMVAEALEKLFFMKLQMAAMEAGIPVADNIAQLAFLTLRECDDKFSRGSILRGLR